MRKCLVISLLFVVAICVGCQTQSWKDTEFSPGSGRDTDAPWQVHSGLFEFGAAFKAGAAKANNETSEEFDGYTLDFEQQNMGANFFLGYMINEYWELGAFLEYASEVWDPDVRHAPEVDEDMFEDGDYTGWCYGPRIVYNFSQTGTDVVPYLAASAGWGEMTYDDDDGELDATRMFGQIGFGLRFFPWDGVALNFEGYYRSMEDDVEGEVADFTIRSDEGGILVGLSLFF
jgi:hypothetical protein